MPGGVPHIPSTLVQYQDPIPREDAEKVHGIVFDYTKVDAKPQITSKGNVLHRILPPRELESDWVQMVSPAVPTRSEVRELTHLFEYRLKDSKARSTGICEVRNIIYSTLFDELIRQVAVDCPERGLLIMHIRDELRMSSDAYKTLYEASVGLGRRKSIEAERGKQEKATHIETLKTKKTSLEKEVRRLEAKLKAMERCCLEQQQADQKKYSEEVSFLQYSQKRLEEQEQTVRKMQEEEKKNIA